MHLSKLRKSIQVSGIEFVKYSALLLVPLWVTAEGVAFGAVSSSSWNSQPGWSSPDQAPSRKPAYREPRYSAYQTSPFAPGSNNVAVDVGQVFLMGDLGTNYGDSIGAQVHYTYGVSDLFGFDSSIGYSDHSEGRFSMTTVLTGLRMNLSWYDKVVPYVVFGLGFYRPGYTETITGASGTTVSSISPLLFGVHLGPGVNLELTRQLFFGASLTFHDVFGNKRVLPSGTPIDVGGTFTSFLLHAGVTF